MKKIIIYISLICLMLASVSCSDYLKEERRSGVTVDYLYSTPEGLKLALNATYALHKTLFYYETDYHSTLMVAYRRSDLVSNGESSTGSYFAEWNPVYLTPNSNQVKYLWNWHYQIISRANEIIGAAETMPESDDLKQIVAEAKCHRAYSYLYLWKSYSRIWLNTKAITPDNVDEEIVYRPATNEEVWALLCDDLNYAIGVLPWVTEPGRYNQAAARHLLSEVSMYKEDWDTVIDQTDAIENSGFYSLIEVDDVFRGANLNHSESLFTQQWSTNLGGTCSPTLGWGHYFASQFGSYYYSQIPGNSIEERCSPENGGYTRGRILPNDYLLGLYDKVNDRRFTEWFIHRYKNTSSNDIKYGKVDGVDVIVKPGEYFPETKSGKYVSQIMPSTRKYWDTDTRANGQVRGYKDLIFFRLAEDYIWAAEAALKKNNQTLAKYYYNKTWERAGNAEFTGVLTMQDIIDEQARELNMEGNRFFYIKRLGLAAQYIKEHGGNNLLKGRFINCRTNIVGHEHFVDLPIPQSQINSMGEENFPQNPGY